MTVKQPLQSSVLVGVGQSKRLDAMRNKVQNREVSVHSIDKNALLQPEIVMVLKQAEHLINQKLQSILRAYPKGKQKTFFKLRYGLAIDKIELLSRKQVFELLKLETVHVKSFRMIQHVNAKGHQVD